MKARRKIKVPPNSSPTELELQSSENHLLATYEHAPIGIVECSLQGIYLNVNEEFCRITGYERQELLNRSIQDVSFHEDYREEAKLYQQLIADEIASYKFEKRYVRRDGELIWLQVIRSCARDRQGNALYTVGFLQDITEQKQTQARAKFQTYILENVHDAIIATDDQLRITYWNRAAEELYGWTAAEVLGKSAIEVTRTEVTDEERALLKGDRGKGKSTVVESIHHHRNGDAIHVESRGIALRDEHGQIVGYVSSMLDVTQRKQAEKALQESEELLRRAFDIETVGIIFFNTQGMVLDANGAFLRMSGYSLDDLKQGSVRWDVMTPVEFMPESLHAIQELVTNKETKPYEKQYIRKDGSRWWGLFSAKLIGENRGVEFILDITDRKQAQEALQKLNHELESRVQSRTAELQSANDALLESQKKLQQLSQRLVEVQEDERRAIARELHDRVAQSLLALKLNVELISNQLGDRSGSEVAARLADSIKLMSEINKLVRDVMADLRPLVLDEDGLEAALGAHLDGLRSRHTLELRFEKSGPPVPRLSPGLEITLLRIAQEALFNVVKHAHATQATLSLRQENGRLYLSVQDNGTGIPPRQATNGTEKRGLKIMRERAEAFGGTLQVTSAPGEGTRVEAVIPLQAQNQSRDAGVTK